MKDAGAESHPYLNDALYSHKERRQYTGLFPCGAGFFFGRTPLIKLSPKKTWEGFLGGLVLTVLCSWLLADLMSRWSWMTCPRTVRRPCPDPAHAPVSAWAFVNPVKILHQLLCSWLLADHMSRWSWMTAPRTVRRPCPNPCVS